MFTLAINTASSTQAIALISQNQSPDEIRWKGKANETKKLIPAIMKLLKRNAASFDDLRGIVVVKGPGSFSAVRIGVTVANMLAYCLDIPLYSIDSETLWNNRKPNPSAILLLHAGGRFVHRSGKGVKKGIFEIKDALRHTSEGSNAVGRPCLGTASSLNLTSPRLGLKEAIFQAPKDNLHALKSNSQQPLVFFGDLTENETVDFDSLKGKNKRFISEKHLKTFGETIIGLKSSMLKKGKTVAPAYWRAPNITKPRHD